ncbi:hypothetical protein HPB52_002458 [Rhipicephalus sanguineus]|uniref:G-protein coupled receptors family 1 profile domain-containing protein n=1 Tax=Rhipicephalus sanguineus TaxID=34632 RepID=A0A9D4SMT5_RHISA|nr:hypothetical protein HPB52_002458 [Rhipicephalus sanguineus]
MVYTVALFPRMRSISDLFLASLASTDLLIVLVCMPVKFGQLFSYTWILGELGCKLLLYVQHVSLIFSVLNLSFLRIESLSSDSSKYTAVDVEMGLRRRAYWCMRDEASLGAWCSFEIYMLILVLCIPTLVMGYAYAKICAQLWMVVRERAHLTSGS